MATKKRTKAKGKNPGGRPLFDGKTESDVLAKLELAFSYGCTDEEACLYADISIDSLYRYERKHEKFRNRKQLLKHKQFLTARQELIQGLKGNPELALRFLERRKKDEFGLHTVIRHEGELGLYELTESEKKELLALAGDKKKNKEDE